MIDFGDIARVHLDAELQQARVVPDPPSPGWIATIRQALGMSVTDLAQRMGVARPVVARLEQSEANGTIKIQTLERAAQALNCRLVYAFVPNTSLDDAVEQQALMRASEEFDRVDHSMHLENQRAQEAHREAAIRGRADELKKSRGLWRTPI